MLDLTVSTPNQHHHLVSGSTDMAQVEELHAKIVNLVGLVHETYSFTPMSETFVEQVLQTCKTHALKAEWKMDYPADLVEKLITHFQLPDQRILFYFNTKTLGNGTMGFVLTASGIFWSRHDNDFLYEDELTLYDRMPWPKLSSSKLREGKNGNILLGQGSQIVLRGETREPIMKLLGELQMLAKEHLG